MNKESIPCNRGNYTAGRPGPVRCLVIHYTGAPGSARDAAVYFGREGDLGRSAHWFVDGHGAVASVPEADTAWHCGARTYRHPFCRNANSIGIELCCLPNGDGTWRFLPGTVENAKELARELMATFGIPPENVLRHWDVTGKRCPEPFVRDGAAWDAFRASLRPARSAVRQPGRWNTLEELPAHYRAEAEALVRSGVLAGRGADRLDLTEDMLRTLIMCRRMVEGSGKETPWNES